MSLFLLFISVFSGTAFAGAFLDDLSDQIKLPEDFLYSISGGFSSVTSSSELQTNTGKKIMEFTPNVPAGMKLSVETKYIELGYTFAGSNRESGKKTSDFSDVRINFYWRSFDVRLNYQNYQGAEVTENGKTAFYTDYEVNASNARVHYYFLKDYLRVIREGRDLVRKAAAHSGFSGTGSLFLGLNLDRRRIELPDNLLPEHEARINRFGINYDTSFYALSGGPLAGGDGMLQWGTFFLRGKLGLGPAFLPGGNTTAQYEIALSSGFAFFENHLISLSGDLYLMAFKDEDQKIMNRNGQINILYTYAF